MAHLIREAGPQEPIHGIHHANIVKRLTRQNWRTKAVADIGDPSKIPLPVDISLSADDSTLFVDNGAFSLVATRIAST